MDLVKVQEIALKHGKAAAKEIILDVVLVAAQKMVDDTANKFDDIAYAALEVELKKIIEGL